MRQVFRDCCKAEADRRTLPGFWLRTLLDLLLTAAKERGDRSGREGIVMNRRRDLMALVLSIGIIVFASLLLTYGRRNEVSSILMLGYVLDALVSAGIAGNLIVFILIKTTKLNPLRIVLATFGIVHSVLVVLTVLIGGSQSGFSLGNVVVGYIVSFLIWTGLHWAWRMTTPQPTTE